MLNKKKIEEQLKNVTKDKCMAFAVRSAMRVLPLLAIPKKKETFWFWGKYKDQHLLAIFRAYGFSIECILTKKYVTYSEAIDVTYAANAAITKYPWIIDLTKIAV